MNTVTLYATAVLLISSANLPNILARTPEKLIDIDSQTKAQVYSPGSIALPSLSNLMPSFLQNLLPASGDKNGYSNTALPLLYTPQLINLLSNDLFTLAGHMLTTLNTVLALPANLDVPDQIARLQKLMREGQISKEYMPYARALVSLLRDQPVLRALQDSFSELQRSTSFNLSASGQGLNNLKLKHDFSLPSTMITPSIQSSFGIATNPDDDNSFGVNTVTKKGSAATAKNPLDDDQSPFIFA